MPTTCGKPKAIVIDVREPDAHRQRHIPGAINMPLDELPDLAAFFSSRYTDAKRLRHEAFLFLGSYFSTVLATGMLVA